MPTYLLWDDCLRSPELRHELGEAVMDPIVFLEHDGRRIVAGSVLERSIFEAREDVVDEYWTNTELGANELLTDARVPDHLVGPELLLRAVRRAGASTVNVPGNFPTVAADHLRAHGVAVVVDHEVWARRRRRKSHWELEGIERAQRAADAAMLTAARMLRDAEKTSEGSLRFEGETLTAELVREAMIADLLALGAECEEIIVHSGDAWLAGHEVGSGPILPDASCIIDCFPRDRRSGTYTDMTRTFVPGEATPALRSLHDACRSALEIAFEAIRPGPNDAYAKVAEHFESQGRPTLRTHSGSRPLQEGFSHELGHGVGLEVHEAPSIGRRGDDFVVGDVVAVEPALYFRGTGGVRLEDTVVVTDAGIEHFTDPLPYDLEP